MTVLTIKVKLAEGDEHANLPAKARAIIAAGEVTQALSDGFLGGEVLDITDDVTPVVVTPIVPAKPRKPRGPNKKTLARRAAETSSGAEAPMAQQIDAEEISGFLDQRKK